MNLKEYQEYVSTLLELNLDSQTVPEWRTSLNRDYYSPVLDVAVGPFSIRDGENHILDYTELFERNIDFISKLVRTHFGNLSLISDKCNVEEMQEQVRLKVEDLSSFNLNSRCFIAVEIENSVSRKHLMGGAINASVLGRIAIVSGYSDEKHNAFLKLYRYFMFLQSVGKPTFKTNNLLIVSASQLLEICESNLASD